MASILSELGVTGDILKLARACDWEEGHTLQVTRLAAKLFDELKDIHKLNSNARRYLISGAILHDIGWVMGASGHHKSAYQLIVDKRPESLTRDEAEIVGQIARYHRKSPPKLTHEPFVRLSAHDREMVKTLSAILRVADGLDRSHANRIRDLKCRITSEDIVIELMTEGNADLEVWGAMRKADLFEEVFGRKLHLAIV